MSDLVKCFYCDGQLSSDQVEHDHFPVPKKHGGNKTVPTCKVCHNMKDRFNIENIGVNFFSDIANDFHKLNRETRIFLARVMKVSLDIQESGHEQT